jgi:glycerol-3-phosphate O-acyltransferase
VREDVAFQTAERYAREIVPGFSAFTYFSFAIRAARFLSQSLYRVRLVQPNEDALAAIPEEATVIFVMNHRSNMDYVLVTWLAAERSALAYAVGEWARVWPLRTLVRAMGGYFIRRRYNNPLYRKVLARYVQMATEAGVTQAVFPEGGLSRTGALGKPKLGLISYILDGFRPGQSRDVVFVPVALNYDRVMEDRNLIEAQANGARAFRFSLRPIYRYLRRQTWLRLTGQVPPLRLCRRVLRRPAQPDGVPRTAARRPTPGFGTGTHGAHRPGHAGDARAAGLPCAGERCSGPVRSSSKPSRPGSRRRGSRRDHPHSARRSGLHGRGGLRALMERRLLNIGPDGALALSEAGTRMAGFYAASVAHLLDDAVGAPNPGEEDPRQRGKPLRHNISIWAISCLLYCAAPYVSLQ